MDIFCISTTFLSFEAPFWLSCTLLSSTMAKVTDSRSTDGWGDEGSTYRKRWKQAIRCMNFSHTSSIVTPHGVSNEKAGLNFSGTILIEFWTSTIKPVTFHWTILTGKGTSTYLAFVRRNKLVKLNEELEETQLTAAHLIKIIMIIWIIRGHWL